jgi:hypothetical protein
MRIMNNNNTTISYWRIDFRLKIALKFESELKYVLFFKWGKK